MVWLKNDMVLKIMLSLGCRPVQCRTDRLCDLVYSTKTYQYAIDGRLQDGSAELDREGGSNTQID